MNEAAENAYAEIRDILDQYIWRSNDERHLQSQMAEVLSRDRRMTVTCEVRTAHGRYDILVHYGSARVVLELKVKGSAAAVERQAQRYALDDVDMVVIVTTSNRLAHGLLEVGGDKLGGKPFRVITVRTS